MNAQQDREIIDKVDSLTRLIQEGFDQVSHRLDKVEDKLQKVEDGVVALDRRLLVVETKTNSIENRFSVVEGKLPDISERARAKALKSSKTTICAYALRELKNWRQISFVILAAIAGWLALESFDVADATAVGSSRRSGKF